MAKVLKSGISRLKQRHIAAGLQGMPRHGYALEIDIRMLYAKSFIDILFSATAIVRKSIRMSVRHSEKFSLTGTMCLSASPSRRGDLLV